MNLVDEVSSGCEFVSENEVNTQPKGKTKAAPKRKKPPLAPNVSESPSAPPAKKSRSEWWVHYEKLSAEIAECIYCQAKIGCSTRNGTNPIKNHILRCKKYPANVDKKQKIIDLESRNRASDDGSIERTIPRLWEFNQEVIRKALAVMLIIDELPFNFVEREGFRNFCKVINPHFLVPSRSTATRDCYTLFIDERTRLVNIFHNLSSRVCLTTDTWTSGQNLSYMCLTAHFIDADWRLHKRIINFCPVIGHSGVIIGRAVEKCLTEWGLRNILTITVDNASSNDVAINHLKKVFNHWDCGVLKGAFLHMRCAAHILNLVVRDGLNDLSLSIKKIRALVKYVRSSPARLLKFKTCIEEEKIESNSLVCMDVDTRWNSTFLMLQSASKFKKAFSNLLLKDVNCEKELKKLEGGLVDETDWSNVTGLLPFLKIFYDATLRFSASRHVTSNAYVHEIFGIGQVIDGYTRHIDPSVRNMAHKMKLKYKKYWGDVEKLNQFLFFSVVLDPTRKWQYIVWVVEENFAKEKASSFLSTLDSNLREMFDYYSASMPKKETEEVTSSSNPSPMWDNEEVVDIDAIMTKQFEMAMGSSDTNLKKTELDKYLGEDREPLVSNSEILKWWKVQECRYPILAKMARDILAIPVSTVASESAFSTGGRVLDSYRTCLTTKMVEALVCAQDWLRQSHTPIMIDEIMLEIEKMEEEVLADLVVQQPSIVIDETIPDSFEWPSSTSLG